MATTPRPRKLEYDIIEPIGKRVVIRKDDNKRSTKSGIVLPDSHEIPVITGRVIACWRSSVAATGRPRKNPNEPQMNTDEHRLACCWTTAHRGFNGALICFHLWFRLSTFAKHRIAVWIESFLSGIAGRTPPTW